MANKESAPSTQPNTESEKPAEELDPHLLDPDDPKKHEAMEAYYANFNKDYANRRADKREEYFQHLMKRRNKKTNDPNEEGEPLSQKEIAEQLQKFDERYEKMYGRDMSAWDDLAEPANIPKPQIEQPDVPEVSGTTEESEKPEKPSTMNGHSTEGGSQETSGENNEQSKNNIDEMQKFKLTTEQKLAFAYRDFQDSGEKYNNEVERIIKGTVAEYAKKNGIKEGSNEWDQLIDRFLKDEKNRKTAEEKVNKLKLGEDHKLAEGIFNEQVAEFALQSKEGEKLNSLIEQRKNYINILNTLKENNTINKELLEKSISESINEDERKKEIKIKQRSQSRFEQIKKRIEVIDGDIESLLQDQAKQIEGMKKQAENIFNEHKSELDEIDALTDNVARQEIGAWRNLVDPESEVQSTPKSEIGQPRTKEEKEQDYINDVSKKIEDYLSGEYNVHSMSENPNGIMNTLYHSEPSRAMWEAKSQGENGEVRIVLTDLAKQKIAELHHQGEMDIFNDKTMRKILLGQESEPTTASEEGEESSEPDTLQQIPGGIFDSDARRTPRSGLESEQKQSAISQIESDLTNKFHTYKPEERSIFEKAAREYVIDVLQMSVPENEQLISYKEGQDGYESVVLDEVAKNRIGRLINSGVVNFVNTEKLEKLSAAEQDAAAEPNPNIGQALEQEEQPQAEEQATPELGQESGEQKLDTVVSQVEKYLSDEFNKGPYGVDVVQIVTSESDNKAPSRTLWIPTYEINENRLGVGLTEAGRQRVNEMLQNGITDFTSDENLRMLFGYPSENTLEA